MKRKLLTKKQLNHLREWDKEYRRQKRAKESIENIRQVRKYEKNNPEKHKAGSILRMAVYNNKIKRGKCKICKKNNAQGHHPDYSKPLEVIWLCPSHHKLLHIKVGHKNCPNCNYED